MSKGSDLAYSAIDDTMFVIILTAVSVMLIYIIYANMVTLFKGLKNKENDFGKVLFVSTRLVIIAIIVILLVYDINLLIDILKNAKM